MLLPDCTCWPTDKQLGECCVILRLCYGITALFRGMFFFSPVFPFLGHTYVIDAAEESSCDSLLIFRERFLSLAHYKEIKKRKKQSSELLWQNE